MSTTLLTAKVHRRDDRAETHLSQADAARRMEDIFRGKWTTSRRWTSVARKNGRACDQIADERINFLLVFDPLLFSSCSLLPFVSLFISRALSAMTWFRDNDEVRLPEQFRFVTPLSPMKVNAPNWSARSWFCETGLNVVIGFKGRVLCERIRSNARLPCQF